MKPVHIIFLLSITAIAACQSAGNNNHKALLPRPFVKDSLAGNWMITYISTNKETKIETDSTWNNLENEIRLTAFSFHPNGTLLIDYAPPQLTEANWQFNNKSKQLLIKYKDTSVPSLSLTVLRYQNDQLILEDNRNRTIFNFTTGKKEPIHLQYTVQRLRTNDTVPDLFNPEINKWRHKPLQAENDAAIKTRLKESLYYYSAYFANIKSNKIPVFNPEKMLCPIKFYNGGIGRKRFKENDTWTQVFFNNNDAKKAHTMLGNAFDNIKGYPDEAGDYVAEYIIALKLVADAL